MITIEEALKLLEEEKDIKTLLSTNEIKDLDKNIKYWINPQDNTCNATILVNGKKARLRASVIIVKDNEILLSEDEYDKNEFSLPGGGLEKGETAVEAATREAQEEVHINVKNVRETGCDYCECHTEVKDWVKENVPEEEWWYHYYTCLCIGEYDSEYEGKVAEVDQDDAMLNNKKWYDIKDVIDAPTFKPQWKEALTKFGYYKKNMNEDLEQPEFIQMFEKQNIKYHNDNNLYIFDTYKDVIKAIQILFDLKIAFQQDGKTIEVK